MSFLILVAIAFVMTLLMTILTIISLLAPHIGRKIGDFFDKIQFNILGYKETYRQNRDHPFQSGLFRNIFKILLLILVLFLNFLTYNQLKSTYMNWKKEKKQEIENKVFIEELLNKNKDLINKNSNETTIKSNHDNK